MATTVTTTPAITTTMLRNLGACKVQRKIFEAEWPDGAEATLENVLRAVELGLDLEWGQNLFSPTARAEYERRVATARVEYDGQAVPLQVERDRQVATLRDEYDGQAVPLRAEYQRQKATLRDEYERQDAARWAEYQRQKATVLDEYQRQDATLRDEYDRQKATIWLAAFLASQIA